MHTAIPPRLVVHTGLRPGDLVLKSDQAINKGVVVLPLTDHPHRFDVDPIAGGAFLLERVTLRPWPEPPLREGLFSFAEEGQAQAARQDIQEALLVLDTPTDSPLATEKHRPSSTLLLLISVWASTAVIVATQLLSR